MFFHAGDITVEDVLRSFPFGNDVERIEVPGRTLLEALKHSVNFTNPDRPRGSFLQMSGEPRAF